MKKMTWVTTVLFILLVSAFAKAQLQENNTNFWDNVRFGGGIGINFGDGYFTGQISPVALYQVDSKFGVGAGLNVSYQTQKDRFKSWVYGPSMLLTYNPINELQMSSELEQLFVNRTFDNSLAIPDDNYSFTALWLGAGYRAGNIIIGVRYDVLYDEDKSVYQDPWAPFVRMWLMNRTV